MEKNRPKSNVGSVFLFEVLLPKIVGDIRSIQENSRLFSFIFIILISKIKIPFKIFLVVPV